MGVRFITSGFNAQREMCPFSWLKKNENADRVFHIFVFSYYHNNFMGKREMLFKSTTQPIDHWISPVFEKGNKEYMLSFH